MNVPDLVAAVTLFALGSIMVAIAPRYGLLGEGGRLAPGSMPALWGAGLMGSAVLVAAVHGFRPRTTAAPTTTTAAPTTTTGDGADRGDGMDDGAGTQRPAPARSWRRPVSIYLLLVLAVLASMWVGFLIAFGALMLVLFVFVERRPLVPSVVTALGTVAVAYLLFDVLLQVPIP